MDAHPVRTGLVELEAFSLLCGRRVLGKLECAQKTKSFKYRGVLNLAQSLRREGKTMLLSSSGGNAGLAAAVVGRELGMETTVFVPTSTSAMMRGLIEKAGAKVFVKGDHWAEANEACLEFQKQLGDKAGFVHVSSFFLM